jgi:hypothetical protein
MIYMVEVNTPANTPETSPLRTKLPVTKGLVYKFHLYMPHGAMGYHHIQVFDGAFQLWPTSPGRNFWGDGIEVDWDDIYYKTVEPWEFVVYSWNDDEVYDHRVLISVGMVSEEAFMMRYLPGLTYEKMLEVLQRMEEQQEKARAALLAAPFPWLPAPAGKGG